MTLIKQVQGVKFLDLGMGTQVLSFSLTYATFIPEKCFTLGDVYIDLEKVGYPLASCSMDLGIIKFFCNDWQWGGSN